MPAITDAKIVLSLPCVAALTVVNTLKAVNTAVSLHQAALAALIAAANALSAAVTSIPVVGPAVTLLLTAVDLVVDIFAYTMDCRTIFKNVTLFLHAKPNTIC